jgi:hypothetical protein
MTTSAIVSDGPQSRSNNLRGRTCQRRGTLSSGFTLRRSSLRWTTDVNPAVRFDGRAERAANDPTRHDGDDSLDVQKASAETMRLDAMGDVDFCWYSEVTGLGVSSTQACLVNGRRRKALDTFSSLVNVRWKSELRASLMESAETTLRSIPATFLLANVSVAGRLPSSWVWLGVYAILYCVCIWCPTTAYRLGTACILQVMTLFVCKVADACVSWRGGTNFSPAVTRVQLRLFCRRHSSGVSFAYLHFTPICRLDDDAPPRSSFPTILIRTPYTRWCEAPVGYILARRGYHVIIEDCRGRGDSEGHFEFLHQQSDGVDAIEWVTSQQWFSSSKGLFLCGISFSGYCALAALHGVHTSGDEKLRRRLLRQIRGIAPLYSSTSLPSIAVRDGIQSWDILVRYSALLFFSGQYGGSQGLPETLRGIWNIQNLGIFSDNQSASIAAALRMGPSPESAHVFTQGRDLDLFNDMLEHSVGDPWFAARDVSGACDAGVPMFFTTAWHDVFVNDAIADFERAERAERAAGRFNKNKLHIFEGNHIQYTEHLPRMLLSLLHFFEEATTSGVATSIEKDSNLSTTTGSTMSSDEGDGEEDDAELKGMPKCDDAAAATNRLSSYSSSSSASTIGLSSSITYDVYNGGHDEACEHWLPAKAPPTIQYYMAAKNALSKSPSAADCRYHYTCDVNNPAPSRGGTGLGHAASGRREQQTDVESRNDLVVFESAPLEQLLRIRGSCVIDIHAASNHEPSAFIGES